MHAPSPMPARPVHAFAAAIAGAFLTTSPSAQTLPVGATVVSVSITPIAQLDAGLDRGGDFHGTGVIAGASVLRQFTPSFAAGINVRYDHESWSFASPAAFGGTAPWRNVHRPGLGLTLSWEGGSGWRAVAMPSVQWAYESGASTGDAVNWGAVLAVSKTYAKDLTLGLGAGVFREIDENRVFPIVLVDWRLSDRWRLANPFTAGPAGGAGLELIHTPGDRWEFAGGGTWRSYRFRLDRDGPTPGGIGEKRQVPVYVRASYKAGPASRLDLVAGVALAGRLVVNDRDDRELVSEDFDPAPILGVTFQTRF